MKAHEHQFTVWRSKADGSWNWHRRAANYEIISQGEAHPALEAAQANAELDAGQPLVWVSRNEPDGVLYVATIEVDLPPEV
jgi:uncharacterized protein YegP (UPF0339 family)